MNQSIDEGLLSMSIPQRDVILYLCNEAQECCTTFHLDSVNEHTYNESGTEASSERMMMHITHTHDFLVIEPSEFCMKYWSFLFLNRPFEGGSSRRFDMSRFRAMNH